MARILVLLGHPRSNSLCAALAGRLAAGALAGGHEVRRIALADLPLDLAPPDYGARAATPADWVTAAQGDLEWCDHWVIVAPLWWGGVPGVLDLFFERVLLPGFAFRYHDEGIDWDRLLAARSARVILTMDTPPFVLRWLWRWPVVRRLRRQVLGFTGIAPVAVTLFGRVTGSSAATRARWLTKAEAIGRAGG